MSVRLFFSLLMVSIYLLLTSCDTSKRALGTASKLEDPYVGTWTYIVKNTPEGNVNGKLIIEKEKNQYRAKVSGNQGDAMLENFTLENNALSGTFDFQGYEVALKGTLDGRSLKGEIEVAYMTFALEGEKVMVKSKDE